MKERLKALLLAVLCATALTLLAWAKALERVDLMASDLAYQQPAASDGEIVVVGIDQYALDELGPYPWPRDVIGSVIDALNESEECRPAAIALDILYIGESDPDTDEYLAEAAGRYGNVIAPGVVTYGTDVYTTESGELGLDDFAVLAVELPYDGLYDVTTHANINVMLDDDGFLRHHMIQATLPDGTVLPSFALAAADMYRAYWGEPPVERPVTNARGFWYLPFSSKPDDYSGISVADVLYGDVDPEYFAGKIVLIGTYASGLQDAYFTAIDHAKTMYGIEIHANAIQAMLWNNYKREVSNEIQLAVLFVLLVLAFWGFWRRKMLISTIVWAVLSGGWVGLCFAMFEAGWVLHILWVPVGVTILFVGCIAANYIQSMLEKQKISSTFGRYVDPAVINELMKEGSGAIELGGQLTDIAVLFVDIRGFTTMSEVLTPPQVVEILNQYLTLTTQSIMDNHGMLDKFVGDCTMAIWNAPLPQEDYVMNACKAAMAMVEGSAPLAAKLEQEFGRTVSFGVGVNVGPAVVGNIGAPKRMDYTAIGDTVNTAARLEANAPGGTVYISRAVADALEGRIRTTSLGDSIKLKGKADGFEVLRLEEIL